MSTTHKTIDVKKLYIGNLDDSVNEYMIMQLFKPFGKITYIEVVVHWTGVKKGLPRGYAFLEFETKEQALNAKNALHGKLLKGKPLVVSFAYTSEESDLNPNNRKNNQSFNNKKPTTISLIKGQPLKNSSTDAKIKAIESKLEALKNKKTSSVTTKSGQQSNRFKPY